jgi:hypothetical protein
MGPAEQRLVILPEVREAGGASKLQQAPEQRARIGGPIEVGAVGHRQLEASARELMPGQLGVKTLVRALEPSQRRGVQVQVDFALDVLREHAKVHVFFVSFPEVTNKKFIFSSHSSVFVHNNAFSYESLQAREGQFSVVSVIWLMSGTLLGNATK